MRRYLSYIYVVLTVVIPPAFGQEPNEEPRTRSAVTEQTPSNVSPAPVPVRPKRRAAPPAYSYRPTQKRPPASQYSPLAAAGATRARASRLGRRL